MLFISTFPGPMYAKPRLVAIIFLFEFEVLSSSAIYQNVISERRRPGFRDCVILVAGAAADADRAYYLAVFLKRDTARENHDLSVIRGVDAKELAARLRMMCEIFSRDIECRRRIGLLLRDIDAADPRAVHAYVGDDISSLVRHRNVHRLADLSRLLFGR